jgi:hypothetical protein
MPCLLGASFGFEGTFCLTATLHTVESHKGESFRAARTTWRRSKGTSTEMSMATDEQLILEFQQGSREAFS